MTETSKLSAILHGKCNQGRRKNTFTGSYMNSTCSVPTKIVAVVEKVFEAEPSHFYAAMYLSYAMNVTEMLSLNILLAPFDYCYSHIFLSHGLSPKSKYNAYFDQP